MKDKYEVVISGMAGKFPESETVEEFENNLMNKMDMVTNDDRRWKEGTSGLLSEVPRESGKVSERDDMDMTFFGLHRRLCQVTDPHQRICLELSFSAIIDAGVNPSDLWGSKTAVIASSVTSETEYECLIDTKNVGISIIGHSRNMQANRISSSMNLTGPSFMVDGSWNGVLYGIAVASDLISKGTVSSAIVSACSLLYTAEIAYHYYRMGRLTSNGRTRCFSNDADGYNRSECGVAFYLQRKEDALRVYGTPLSMCSSYIGSKSEPISEISEKTLKGFIKTFYEDNNIDPNSIGFIEAAGTASKVVDAAELNVLGEVLAKKRQKPLLVGSVKSNIGHTEAASSGASLAKALIIANKGSIPPNLHYNQPNDMVPYLTSAQIQVVTEQTPLEGDLIGINSFGCAGGFSHVLIKRHDKPKNRKPEKNVLPPDGLPRLFILSGRNEEGLKAVLERVEQRPIDEEYIALANFTFKKGINKHSYRGYTVINDTNRRVRNTKAFFTGGQPVLPIWFVFTGMGSQWPGMGVELMKIPIFAKAINHCHQILKPKGIDLIHIITTPKGEIFNNILHSFVGIAAIQIGLVDILTELGIKPDGIIGHSVGELGCGYADGCLTADQMILAAYARGRASIETDLIPGMMAAVGRGYAVMKSKVPEGIEVACHNSSDSCTLSGPAEQMEGYIVTLKEEGVFAKLVNVANIAYHSSYIRPAAPALLRYLKEVIPSPKSRSPKWISSSVPKSDWDKESAKYCSAEYHTNNLLGSVLFEEAARHIPSKAVIIEIAPHGLLQAILKRSFPDAVHVPLTSRNDDQGLIYLMNALGKLYLEGIDMDLEKLYPPIEYPVSRGTPCLDDLVVWDHTEKWRINLECTIEDFDIQRSCSILKTNSFTLDPASNEFKFLEDHEVYGRPIIPFSWYLALMMQHYQKIHNLSQQTIMVKNIQLQKYQDVRDELCMQVSLGIGSGYWEITMDNNEITSGEIISLISDLKTVEYEPALGTDFPVNEVYNYFSHMGHNIGPSFRIFRSIRLSTTEVSAVVVWNGNLTVFLDAILKLPSLLATVGNKLFLVSQIKQLIIDLSKFQNSKNKELQVSYSAKTQKLVCDGLQILYPKCHEPMVSPRTDRAIFVEELKFIPYESPNTENTKKLLELCINILCQKMDDSLESQDNLSIIEVLEKANLHDELYEVLKWRNNVKMKIAVTDSNLDGYSVDVNSEYCLIVTGSSEMENSLNVIRKARGGLILFVGSHTFFPPSDLSIVFSKILKGKTYTLCALKESINENLNYISTSSPNWKDQIKRKLEENENKIVYLTGKIASLDTINILRKECSNLPNAKMLRYIFTDSTISEFEPMKFREQLEKDHKINILRDGKWETCLLQSKNIIVDKKASLKTVYEFSRIRIEGDIIPKALGLNFNDVTNNSKKLEVYEFSGVTKNKEICGIGRLSETSCVIHPDPYFIWDKPEGWLHEEVAAILMSYAMAFHIMNMKFNFRSERLNNILVHRGVLPLSQAVINVALSVGASIYTTYGDSDEKNLINKMFPQIPECNVLNYKSDFGRVISDITNGKGVRIVVNTLAEKEYLKNSLECIGYESIFLQVNQQVFKKPEKIGMFIFLQMPCVTGISPNFLLNLNENEKSYIQTAIKKGFQNGIIKPFSTVRMSSKMSNAGAKNIIRSNSFSDKKVIVLMEPKVSRVGDNFYLCDQKATYAILGTGQGFWLDLLFWLSKRGAHCFHIFENDNMLHGIGRQKLHNLLMNNPDMKCIFTPEKNLKDVTTAQTYIEEINKNGKLDTFFILGQENKEIIQLICQISKTKKVVVINQNADVFCEERINLGLPTLAISLPSSLMTSYDMLPILDLLLCNEQKSIFISEKNIKDIDIDIERTAFFNHLPATVKEISALGQGPLIACWKERKSSSPPHKSCPELPPVFVLPPLRSGQMDYIIKSLFYPTFIAVMSKDIQGFDETGYQLYKDLKRFNTGVFTIICSDWSWPIGVILGKLLEKDGKEVSLIFFESCITWESQSTYGQVFNIVNKDFMFNSLPKQEKKRQRMKTQYAIKKLKHLLDLFGSKLPSETPKIRGICHYIRNNETFMAERVAKLQEYCERTINVFTSAESDYLNMMKSKDVVKQINSSILFEYKDAAKKIEKVYVEGSTYNNTRLSYMTFMQSLQLNKIASEKLPTDL